jgi:hypothetical protein
MDILFKNLWTKLESLQHTLSRSLALQGLPEMTLALPCETIPQQKRPSELFISSRSVECINWSEKLRLLKHVAGAVAI